MKYYIMFGPPGSGKGTHSVPMVRDYNLRHLSTGELLRAEIARGSELGRRAEALISQGNLVPDSIVEGMIENCFDTEKGVEGFLLDGFPRTISQAEDLDAMLSRRGEKVDAVISLTISEDMIRTRLKNRAVIEGRADDASDEIVTNRLKTYHEKTEPLIAYYSAKGVYHEVDGYGGEGEPGKAVVYSRIHEVMESI